MVETTKRERESVDSFIRRFNRELQDSGKLLRAKEVRYHEKEPSRNMRRSKAIKYDRVRRRNRFLRRIGKLQAPRGRGRGRRR